MAPCCLERARCPSSGVVLAPILGRPRSRVRMGPSRFCDDRGLARCPVDSCAGTSTSGPTRSAGASTRSSLRSAIAPSTSAIGIVPVTTTTHTEPFHISKSIATLDYVSHGRAGMQARISATDLEARQFGRRVIADPNAPGSGRNKGGILGDLFDEAADFIEVSRKLWDSWEDDAEIRDVATGRFVDRDKLHYIDFEGRWFSVKGPSITPRPPQGQPVVSGPGPCPTGLPARSPQRRRGLYDAGEHGLGPIDRTYPPRLRSGHSPLGTEPEDIRRSGRISRRGCCDGRTAKGPTRRAWWTAASHRCLGVPRYSTRLGRPDGGVAVRRHRGLPPSTGGNSP